MNAHYLLIIKLQPSDDKVIKDQMAFAFGMGSKYKKNQRNTLDITIPAEILHELWESK